MQIITRVQLSVMHNTLSILMILIHHELSERNERIATELNNTLNQLQDRVETSSLITDKSKVNQCNLRQGYIRKD